MAWLGPLAFALLEFTSISAYSTSTAQQNRDVSDYLFSASAIVFFVLLCFGERISIARSTQYTIGAFLVSAAISIAGSPSPSTSLLRFYMYLALALFTVAVGVLNRHAPPTALRNYFIAIASVHSYFLVEIIFWLLSSEGYRFELSRAVPHFSNMRHFGYLGFYSAACASSLTLLSRRLDFTAFALTTLALFGIVLLGSRGAFVAWLIFLVLICAMSEARKRLASISLAASLTSGLGVYACTESGLIMAPSLWSRFANGIQGIVGSSGRLGVWIDALKAWSSNPWFGFGPEGYKLSKCCATELVQPHNAVIQSLLEFGLIGTILLVLPVLAILRRFTKARGAWTSLRSDVVLQSLSAILVASAAFSMIDGLAYHVIPLTHTALLTGLACARSRQVAREGAPQL